MRVGDKLEVCSQSILGEYTLPNTAILENYRKMPQAEVQLGLRFSANAVMPSFWSFCKQVVRCFRKLMGQRLYSCECRVEESSLVEKSLLQSGLVRPVDGFLA